MVPHLLPMDPCSQILAIGSEMSDRDGPKPVIGINRNP